MVEWPLGKVPLSDTCSMSGILSLDGRDTNEWETQYDTESTDAIRIHCHFLNRLFLPLDGDVGGRDPIRFAVRRYWRS